MSENFFIPENERNRKLYESAKSPTELATLATIERDRLLGSTPGSFIPNPQSDETPQRLPTSPVDHRASGYYCVIYPGANDRYEITADSEEELQQKCERIYRLYKR